MDNIQPEPITQEFRDITEVALQNEIKTASELFGPMQLATLITTNIDDSDYLKEVIVQMQNNLNGR